jgi:hypothetical protein
MKPLVVRKTACLFIFWSEVSRSFARIIIIRRENIFKLAKKFGTVDAAKAEN